MSKKREPVRISVNLRSVPFDMLRYDRACPLTEVDAGNLERIASGNDAAVDHVVDFICYAEGAPARERWASFGCRVLAVFA